MVKERPVIPARPTLYKGVQMRSRLEADFAAALDRDGETWRYERLCFAGPEGQWLTDFIIGCDEVLTELKPAYIAEWDRDDDSVFDIYARVDKILRQISVAWLSRPDATLQLVFWTYGSEQVDAPLSLMATGRDRFWLAYTPSTRDVPLLWPGMDQLLTVAERSRQAKGDSA